MYYDCIRSKAYREINRTSILQGPWFFPPSPGVMVISYFGGYAG